MQNRWPDIVKAMRMVSVVMCDEHGIDPVETGRENLFAVIRRRINHHHRLSLRASFLEQN
jgi:hypothetical protein